MLIIREPMSLSAIRASHAHFYQDLVKIVVDLENRVIAADAEMHADLEQALLEQGGRQQHLWGANLYFTRGGEDFIEYTSLINIRPSQKNLSMEIQDPALRLKVTDLVHALILHDVFA